MNLIFLIQPDIVSQVNEDVVGTTDVFFDLKTVILIVAILVLVIINLTLLRMLKKSNSKVRKLNNKPDYSHFKNIEQNTYKTKIENLKKANEELKKQFFNKSKELRVNNQSEQDNVLNDVKCCRMLLNAIKCYSMSLNAIKCY